MPRQLDWNQLPPLPDALAAQRDAMALVASSVIDHLYAALSLPAKRSRHDGVDTVEVLGYFRLHFDAGRRDVRLEGVWRPLVGGTVDLLDPLSSDAWRRIFAERFLPDLHRHFQHLDDVEALTDLALGWLGDLVERLAEESGLLDHARAELRKAYPLDEAVMRDLTACTLTWPSNTMSSLSMHRYAWAWRHAEVLRQRLRDSATLAPLWALVAWLGMIDASSDYDVMKALFEERGIRESGWRLLRDHRDLVCAPIARPGRPRRGDVIALCNYVCMLQKAQLSSPMHPDLARAFLANHWFGRGLHRRLPIGLVRGAITRFDESHGQDKELFLHHELPGVLGWLARARPALDANQKRAPWSWFLQRSRDWDGAECHHREGTSWTHGIDGLRWNGHAVVPIRDSLTLWQEGQRMRLCIAQYEDICADGEYVLYRVMPMEAGDKPLAVIGISFDARGTAGVEQVRGFANGPVDAAIERYAQHVADLHNAGKPT